MRKKAEKNKYISLKEAAKLSGYAPDYIGYLIRKGKIGGKAISLRKAWFTTAQAIAKYQAEKKAKKKPRILKRKKPRIFWYRRIASTVLKSPRFALPILIFLLVGFSTLAIYAISSKEVKTEIFPTVWQDDWQNGQNALTRELSKEAILAEFNSENSAFLNVPEIISPILPLEEEIPPEEEAPAEEEAPSEEELPSEEEQPFLEEELPIEETAQEEQPPQEEVSEQPPLEEPTEEGSTQEEQPVEEQSPLEEESAEEEAPEEPSQEESLPSSEEQPPPEESQPEEQSFLQKFFSRFSFLPWASAQEMEPEATDDEPQEVSDQQEEIQAPETFDTDTEPVDEIEQETGEPVSEGVEEEVGGELEEEAPETEEPAEELGEELIEEELEEEPVEEEPESEIILPTLEGELLDVNGGFPEEVGPPAGEAGVEGQTIEELEEKEEFEEEAVTVFLNQSSIIYSGFVLPEEKGILKGVRVGFSFSAEGQEGEDDEILVDWSLDGENWNNLATLQQNQEYSNARNSGYFYFDPASVLSWENLKNLKIKFTALTNNPQGEELPIYLDSIWLEATYQQPEEIVVPEVIEEPEITLLSLQKDFEGDEEPEFQFHYKKIKSDFLTSAGETLGILNYWENINVVWQIIDPEGETLEVLPNLALENNGEIVFKLKRLKEFKPGRYKIILRIEDGSAGLPRQVEEFEQDFTWGVLAININKSIYLPGEEVYLQMAVLNDDGHTICDASLKLEIQNPQSETQIFSTEEGTIRYSGKCGPSSVTDKPDYFAYYQVGEVGVYQMKLTNLDNGYEITDQFEARDWVPFDIERIGPTRIWPVAAYGMTLKIKANQDFTGEVIEHVPDNFQIKNQIVWQVDWKTGENYELQYQFDAPDVSPYLYLLGPLEIGGFKEIRQWQIASDAAPSIESYTDIAVANVDTFNVNLPSGTVVGNLLLAIIAKDDDDAMASSHGFTEAYSIEGADHATYCWYKIADAADITRTYVTFTGDREGYVGRMYRITGFDSGTPIDVVDTTGNTDTSAIPKALSVETVTDDALVFAVTGMDDNDEPYALVTGGWTEDLNTSVTTAGIVIGRKVMVTKGLTGDVDFTTDASDGWAASQVAIRPAPPLTTTVSGTVYGTDEAAPLGADLTIKLVNSADTTTSYTDDTDGDGYFEITGISPPTNSDILTLWIDEEGDDGTLVLNFGAGCTGGNCTGSSIYKDRVIIRDENSESITNAMLAGCDNDSGNDQCIDIEIGFTSNGALTVSDGRELHIWDGDTFQPGGTVTTDPSADNTSADGDLHIDGAATLNIETNALSVGGDFNNEGTFTKSSGQTTTFTATATGHSITDGGGNFDTVVFNVSSGGWSFADSTIIDVDLTMTAGTLSGTNDITVYGNVQCGASCGTINLTSASTFKQSVSTDKSFAPQISGDNDWTFYSLTFDSSSETPTITFNGTNTGTITVSNNLTLTNNGTSLAVSNSNDRILDVNNNVSIGAGTTFSAAPSASFTVGGNWANSGAFVHGSGTVTFDATDVGNTVEAGTSSFNNVTFSGTGGGNGTWIVQTNDMTVAGTLNVNTGDTLSIASGRTVTHSGSTLTLDGTISGDGTLTYQSATDFPDTGTISSILRFDTTNNDQTMSERTYGGLVEAYNNSSTNARTITMGTAGTQTLNFSGNLYLIAANTQNITLAGNSWSPTVNISGDLDFTGTDGGTEIINSGTGTWTVSGNVNFTDGTYTATSTNILKMDGTSNSIIGAGQSLDNFTVDPSSTGTITLSTSDLTVSATLTVADTDALSIDSGRTLTHTGATLTLSGATGGTISGAGTLRFTEASGGPGTDGTISSIVRYDTTNGNIASTTLDARTYNNKVEIYSNSTTARTVTFAGGAYNLSGSSSHLHLIAAGASPGNLTLTGETNSPTVTIEGDLDFTGVGTSSEIIVSGTGIWTVSGNVNFSDGQFTASTSNTLKMNGDSKDLTSNGQTLQNFEVSGGSISTIDALDVNGTFKVTSGTFTQGTNVDLNVAGNFTLSNGIIFDATGAGTGLLILDGDLTYQDNTSPLQDVGDVHIGTSPAITDLDSNMKANSLTVNTDDIFYTNGYDLDIGNNGITINGTFNAINDVEPSETFITNDGNFTINSGATFVQDQSTLTFGGPSGTDDLITDGSFALYNLIINGASLIIEVEDPLDVDNDLTITAGTLDVVSGENNSINVGGSWDNDNTFEARSGTVTFDAGSGTPTIDADGTGTDAFYDIVFDDSGGGAEWDLTTTMDVNHNLTITGGTFDANSNNITVGGNWTNNDIFTSGTQTVTFDATDAGHTINAGSSSFSSVTFDGSNGEWSPLTNTMTITGDLTLTNGTFNTTSGTADVTVNGNVQCGASCGTISMTSTNTFNQRVSANKNFGTSTGANTWAFYNLTFSNSNAGATPITITTSTDGSGEITVSGILRIGKSGDDVAGATTALNANNRTWTLSGIGGDPFQILASPAGDLTPSGSTFAYTGDNGAGNTTVQSETYNILQINNGDETYILEGATTGSDVTITAGILDLNGNTLTATNDLTVNGTLQGAVNVTVNGAVTGSGTVTLTGGVFEQEVAANETFGSSDSNNWTFNDLKFNNSDAGTAYTISPNAGTGDIIVSSTLTLGDSGDQTITFNNEASNDRVFDINGSFLISTKGMFSASSSVSFRVAGNFTDNKTGGGGFTANSGTVTFDTTGTSVFDGSGTPAITFYNFTSTTANKTLQFTADKTFRIDTGGKFTIEGASGSQITIDSTTSSQWFINHQGTENVTYANISNSGCDGSSTNISLDDTSTDSDNNGSCWLFPSLSFTLDSVSKSINLTSPNFTNTTTTTLTVSTSATFGYELTVYETDYMRHTGYSSVTIDDFQGTNTTPDNWETTCTADPANMCGFGYTTNDDTLPGADPDRFVVADGVTCTTAPCYAKFTQTGPGEVVANSTEPVTSDATIITYKSSVSQTQEAGPYQTIIRYIVTPRF